MADKNRYQRQQEAAANARPRGRGPMVRMPGQKLDFGVLKRAMAYLLHYKARCAISLCCIIFNAVIGAVSSIVMGKVIDIIEPMKATGFDGGKLFGMMIGLAIVYLITIGASFLNARIFIKVTQGILRDIRNDMFAHMQTLPIKYFDQNTFGNIMSHYTNDTDTLRQLISQTIPNVISAAITVVTTFVSMLISSVWLTLFVLVFVAFMLIITTKIGMVSGRYFVKQQEALGNVNGFVEEMINGQKVVQVFTHEEEAITEFNEFNNDLAEASRKANSIAGTMGPIMGNMGNLSYVLIAILGAVLASVTLANGEPLPNLTLTGVVPLTIGTIVAFLRLSSQFQHTVSNISRQMSAIVMAMAGAKRVFDLMDMKPEIDEGSVTLVNAREDADGNLTECKEHTGTWAWKMPMPDGEFVLIKLKGDVRMNNVDFGYVENKQVLYDISLYAKPGQKIAFVGSTGAGKTTITNLINRFYDIQSGEITYDGIPITGIKKDDLRHSLGIVLQDVNLFTGTIRENIRYGKLDATDEEVITAAKLANAHDFISRLPEGYDTVIDGTGSQLSQGQCQLLSIARAAIADPPVMILDEATSSIDTRTEAIVQRGMDSIMKGRTVFVIAHRLSTVQNANVILVLEHGHVIERGTHEDLIAQKGRYYQLYTGAFELE